MSDNGQETTDTAHPEKTMAERSLEIGRDGAYLEVDAKELIAAARDGRLKKAKIVVITAARIELSDHAELSGLSSAIGKTIDTVVVHKGSNGEYAGLNDEQASFLTLRKLLVAGMK
jgi:hypothetical protein